VSFFRSPHHRYRPLRHVAIALLVLPVAGACRATPPAFGTTASDASQNATDFFGGVANRFTSVTRTPKFAAARGKLARHALSPSSILNDTSVWTSVVGNSRTLTATGRLVGEHYVFDATANAVPPTRPGDTWHSMRLSRLPGQDEYRWDTGVDMAVGDVRPSELHAVWSSLLATVGRHPPPMLRAEYRAAFPRTTRVMGVLASLDSLRTSRQADGSTTVSLVVSLHPERVRAAGSPAFARYLEKYVQPARYSMVFADQQGGRWLVATARDNRLEFQLRTRDGRLLPLNGPARPMPARLRLDASFFVKFSIFTVGVSELVADVAVLGDARERGWDFRFRKEPRWHLPLATRHFIRSALRRPFEGEGAHFRLSALRAEEDGPTLIVRRTAIDVKESALVRWLGGLGSGAMSDFAGQAEAEENRFAEDVFRALAADCAALLGGEAPDD
jgi:hypothetical protein